MKYSKEVKSIIVDNLEKNNMFEVSDKQNAITNKFITLFLELKYFNEIKVQNILTKEFTLEELKKYSKEYLNNEIVKDFEREQVHRISQKTGINTEERKQEFKRRVTELEQLLLKMIDGDIEAYKEFNEKYEKYVFDKNEVQNRGMQKFIPLGMIISLSRNLENPLELAKEEKFGLRNLSYFVAKRIISDIKYEIGYLQGLRKKRKDTAELLDSFKQVVEDSTELDENEEESLESIKLERDQYKKSLQFIQKSLNELSENLEEETQNMVAEQIKEFFVSLNSAKYGNFLDKIPLTEELLRSIRKNEIEAEIPQEIKRVLMFIKSVIKFVKDQGITPIDEVNRVFEGTAEEIAEMDYVGEEFIDDEVKKMRVIAPGYKYKNLIISIPKVEEVKA